jgi:hypothetical protein
MSTSLTVTLVLAAGGAIDQDASRAAFNTALSKYIAEREVEQTQIAQATSETFDQYKGASINMPALASMVAQKLNAQPANFKVLSERVLQYVRDNAQGEDSLFVIGKGKGGGCSRRADRPAKG